MNLIRKIKISKLVDNLTDTEKEIIDFIKGKLDDLIPFKWDEYPLSMFYMNSNGEWVLEQDNKNDVLWIKHYNFWQVLDVKYLMTHNDVQILLHYMIEQAFKEKLSIPISPPYDGNPTVEEAFKKSLSNIVYTDNPSDFKLEEKFKEQYEYNKEVKNK